MNIKIIVWLLAVLSVVASSSAAIISSSNSYNGACVGTACNSFCQDVGRCILLNQTGGGSIVTFGNPFDQVLNTTSNVTFDRLTADYGYFRELNVSNSSIYVGGTKLTSNEEGLNISTNVTSPFYYGSGKFLTDINLSNVNGTSTFTGDVSIYGILNMFDNIDMNGHQLIDAPYYTKTEVDNLISDRGLINNTIIEEVNCDGTCTTIIEVEYI